MDLPELISKPASDVDRVRRLLRWASTVLYEQSASGSEPAVLAAMDGCRDTFGEDSPEFAEALVLLGRLRRDQDRYEDALTALRHAIEIQDRNSEAHFDVRANAEMELGRTRLSTGDIEAADSQFQRILARVEERFGARTEEYADALEEVAYAYYWFGHYLRSEELERNLLDLRRNLNGDSPRVARSLISLAITYEFNPEFQRDPEPLLQECVTMLERVGAPDSLDFADALYRLARTLAGRNRTPEAHDLYSRLERMLQGLSPSERLDADWMYSGFADYLRSIGDDERADSIEAETAKLWRRSLDAKLIDAERDFGHGSLEVADVLIGMASADLGDQERRQDSCAACARSLEIRTNELGSDSPYVVEALLLQARLSPDRDYAISLMAKVIEIQDRSLAADDAARYEAVRLMAGLRESAGEIEEAERLYLHGIDLPSRTRSRESRDVIEALYRLSIFFCRTSRLDDAEPVLVEIISTSTQCEEIDSLERADYIEHYAKVLAELGRDDQATEFRREVKSIWEASGQERDDL